MVKIKLITYVLWLLFITSFVGGIVLLSKTRPDSFTNISLFYASVFGFCISILTIAGFSIRRVFGQRELVMRFMFVSFRQAFWLALLIIISLLLASNGLFSWLNAVFLALVFIFLESYLLTKKQDNVQP